MGFLLGILCDCLSASLLVCDSAAKYWTQSIRVQQKICKRRVDEVIKYTVLQAPDYWECISGKFGRLDLKYVWMNPYWPVRKMNWNCVFPTALYLLCHSPVYFVVIFWTSMGWILVCLNHPPQNVGLWSGNFWLPWSYTSLEHRQNKKSQSAIRKWGRVEAPVLS